MVAMTDIQRKVFFDRYALKNSEGTALEQDPEDMFRRVAESLKDPEYTDLFFNVMSARQFIPGGRVLAGAGTSYDMTLSNCFVLPSPEDSCDGIVESLRQMIHIMRRGGGVGINLSSLRPRGSRIKTVNGVSSGPVPWAELFSVATGETIQQGGSRRGALLLMLNDNHPDVEEFITVKSTPGKLEYANLSVAISDAFMDAVKRDADWKLVWDGEVRKVVKARYLWDLICSSAWASGEPGVVFLDRYNKLSNVSYLPEETLISVNPCGEEALPAYGTCNLGNINLAAFVNDDGEVLFDALRMAVMVGVRFLDDVIDLDTAIFPEQRKVQQRTRRIGLGTMGLADALIKAKIRYGSPQSLEWIDEVYGFIRNEAYAASVDLARQRGAFPAFTDEYLKRPFIMKLPHNIYEGISRYGIRNAVLLCQAPTGTTSLLAGVSSGIEPVYSFVAKRRDRLGEHSIVHPLYEAALKQFSGRLPDYFVTALELSPEEHVRVQARIQQYVDQSISKTVNAPSSHTVEDTKKVYDLAYELGCKGIAYFRDGSRGLQILSANSTTVTATATALVGVKRSLGPLEGRTYKLKYPHDGESATLFVTVNGEGGRPVEVFLNGKGDQEELATVGWAVSKLLQQGYPVESLIENLWEFRGLGGVFAPGAHKAVSCVANAVAYALAQYTTLDVSAVPVNRAGVCPKCSGALVKEEGCERCTSCGWARCG